MTTKYSHTEQHHLTGMPMREEGGSPVAFNHLLCTGPFSTGQPFGGRVHQRQTQYANSLNHVMFFCQEVHQLSFRTSSTEVLNDTG
jgi:hypothetical protein